MGALKRNPDGTYSHVRGAVPWADNALDNIAAADEVERLRRQLAGAVGLLAEVYEVAVGAVDRTNPDQKRELHRLSLLLDKIEPHLPRGGQ